MIDEDRLNAMDMRELSYDEIEDIAGAGIISWLRRLFGGDDPQPARGPFNEGK